jgi:hypothetical protein
MGESFARSKFKVVENKEKALNRDESTCSPITKSFTYYMARLARLHFHNLHSLAVCFMESHCDISSGQELVTTLQQLSA